MAKFKDGAGREWTLAIDVFLLEKVQADTGVRLDQLYANRMAGLLDLLGDPVRLGRVLWAVVQEQAEPKAIDVKSFARAIWGDALEDAATALQEAVSDFASRRQRTVLKALAAKVEQVAEIQTAEALRGLAEIDPAEVAALARTLSDSATNSPASSESTPAPEG